MKFIVFVVLAAALVATISADDECPRFCPANYAPFCGAPTGRTEPKRTFSNECEMRSYNCVNKDKPYDKLSDGQCQ